MHGAARLGRFRDVTEGFAPRRGASMASASAVGGSSYGRMAGVLAGVGWLAIHFACSLPTEQKTACIDSSDCVDARICDDGECMPGACVPLCDEVCRRRADCQQGGPECLSTCLLEHTTLAGGTSEDDCKRQWDLLEADPDCAVTACMAHCRDLCTTAASCKLIADATACTVGCQLMGLGCDDATPTDCTEVPTAVQCYEAQNCEG